jgi:phage/plasmid-associated DNA primase
MSEQEIVQTVQPAELIQEDVKQDLEAEDQDEQEEKVELIGSLNLEEEVNMTALRIIRDNFKECFRRLGGMWVLDNCEYQEADEKTALTLINDLYTAKLKSNKVVYHFLRRLKSGRRFAKNSLQGVSRKIRHTIAKDIYYDVDMKNAHPVFCLDLCKKLQFKHKILDKYVKNRDELLTNWIGVEVLEHGNKRTLKNKDDVKEYFLKILNGGGNGKTDNEDLNEFWSTHQTLLSNFYKHPDYKRFRERAIKKYKEEQKKPNGKKYDNKKGTCINYYLCEIENLALTHIEKYLEENGIKYGTLCFDGIMIYKKDVKDTHDLLNKLEAVLLEKMGFSIKLAIKEMNEFIDISDLKAKADLKTTDEDYALYLLEQLKDDIKYNSCNNDLYFWNEGEALWRKQKTKNLRTYISKILTPYISQSPDPKIVEEQTVLIKSDSKQSAIVRSCEPFIEQRRDDEYISTNFDRRKGLFPISNRQVVDLRTSQIRERTKEDCFTKTTSNELVKVSEEDRAYIMKYYEDLLTPYEGKEEEVFGKNYNKDPAHENEFTKHRDGLISIFAYAMTTENHLKKFPNFIGERDGGKSACVEHHSKIFGEFCSPANERLFVAQKSKAVHDTEIFALKGQKMVFLSETEAEDKYNEVLIKKITGGDEMNIRQAKADHNVIEKFDTLLIVATNQLCQFKDDAFKDRLLCYNFCNKFKKDASVPLKLASLRNQFFSVLVEYCKKFYDNGLTIEWSKYALEYTQKKKDEQDTIKVWLNEGIEIVKYDKDNKEHQEEEKTFFLAKDTALYDSYKNYWANSKRQYEGKITFFKRFEEIFKLPEAKKINNAVLKNKMGWAGIKQIVDEPVVDEPVEHPKPLINLLGTVSDLDHGITQTE